MAFMYELLKQNKVIWDLCAATPFVKELQTGDLPLEKFKRYMIQDSIYLKQYARVFGMAIYRSVHVRDIQMYYSMLGFVTGEESLIRLSYLKQFGLTEDDVERFGPLPENQNYIDFLFRMAERGDVAEILMAVLPCMLSYSYIFHNVMIQGVNRSVYSDFIQDYAEKTYYRNCKVWCEYADQKCSDLPEPEKEKLRGIFKTGSLLELDFWRMAYGTQEMEMLF